MQKKRAISNMVETEVAAAALDKIRHNARASTAPEPPKAVPRRERVIQRPRSTAAATEQMRANAGNASPRANRVSGAGKADSR
jgi:hypothetical protein